MTKEISKVPGPVWLMLMTAACLLPFASSAFKIDDTLFLRAAEQIRGHPLDFYGFTINWFGKPAPMVSFFENPPLASYFMALVSLGAGWSEVAMHAAFVLPAIAAILGTYFLARRFCQQPFLAGMVALFTPVFLVSATTVMCDVLLLAFWVWSIFFLERGIVEKRLRDFLLAGALAGFAVLTKYSGLALAPLFAVYGLLRLRKGGWWLVAPVLPCLVAVAYEWHTRRLYGVGLFSSAVSQRALLRTGTGLSFLPGEATGVMFAGGCFLPALFYAPWTGMRRVWLFLLGAGVAGLVMVLGVGRLRGLLNGPNGSFDTGCLLQMELFVLAVAFLALLLGREILERRDHGSWLLLLWIAGVFVFATGFNWTVNGRSLLSMAPAVGILLARGLGHSTGHDRNIPRWLLALSAAAGAMLSLAVVRADCNTANVNRRAAAELCSKYVGAGGALWFQGHWGFQYYMEKLGAKPLDLSQPLMRAGDLIVLPNLNVDVHAMDPRTVAPVDRLDYPSPFGFGTISSSLGASFYASVLGPMPYAFGSNSPQRFVVFRVGRPPGR